MQVPYRKPGKYSLIKPDPMMTEGKLVELKNKMRHLLNSRPAAAAEVVRLAQLGDFSENAEYQHAKGRLRGINNGILSLEYQINHAEIIEKKDNGIIGLGSFVTVEINSKRKTYQILGSSQTDPSGGVISHLSPIGNALMNHKAGDTVELLINGRKNEYKIIEVK